MSTHDRPVVELWGAGFARDARRILIAVDWRVGPGEHWAVIGPNGSGKATLPRLATGYEWPTAGAVPALGERCWLRVAHPGPKGVPTC